MKVLNSFNNSTVDFKLEADVIVNGPTLKVFYKINDHKNLLNLPTSFTADQTLIREDGLWNDTCFELFLRPTGQKSYYEFNFSLKPAWNAYVFASYRHPQPPTLTDDISLQKLQWNGQQLEVELSGLNPTEKYEASLTAVLKEKSGSIHYMAVKHAGPKADFHHSDSFFAVNAGK